MKNGKQMLEESNEIEINYSFTFEQNIEINKDENIGMYFTATNRQLIDNAYDIDYGTVLTCLKIIQDALPESKMSLYFYDKYAHFVSKNEYEYVNIFSIEKLEYNNPDNIEILISAKIQYDFLKQTSIS